MDICLWNIAFSSKIGNYWKTNVSTKIHSFPSYFFFPEKRCYERKRFLHPIHAQFIPGVNNFNYLVIIGVSFNTFPDIFLLIIVKVTSRFTPIKVLAVLTHYKPMFYFHTPWKHQKNSGCNKIKINSNFYFHIFLWCLKRFCKGLKFLFFDPDWDKKC